MSGEAENCINGLSLCNENYTIALNLLKERYADKQVLISSHMNKLLELKSVHEISNTVGLRALYDHVNAQVRSLLSIGLNSEDYGPMLIPVLMSKLPQELKLIITRQFGKDVWNINNILKSLKDEIETREKLNLTVNEVGGFPPFSGVNLFASGIQNNQKGFDSSTSFTQNNQKRNDWSKNKLVVFCAGEHKAQKCPSVTKLETRKFILKKSGRCFMCLKQGHIVRNCPEKMKCFICTRRHHMSICDFETTGVDESSTNVASGYLKVNHINSVLLQTARASVLSTDEKHSSNLRILFDSGSQNSFISPRARKILNLETTTSKNMTIKAFGGGRIKSNLDVVRFCVKSKNQNLNVYVNAFVNEICHPLANQEINLAKKSYPYLVDLDLADSNPENLNMDIDILIGADYYWQFIGNFTVRSQDGFGPVAIASKLGFVLSGPISNSVEEESSSSQHVISSTHVLKVQSEIVSAKFLLQNTLNKFWDLESLGISPEEHDVVHQFKADVKFNDEGRYEVKLPFKESHEHLNDNFITSKNRLNGLMKKFKNDEKLLKEYNDIFVEQERLGIIEKAPENYCIGKTHYLPHRAIIRDDKSTTKIRIVFDASSKKQGPSLNDCLHAGPSLTASLFSVLVKFRERNIAFIADVEKAFLQISLDPEHRDYVRFLWFKNPLDIEFENIEHNELIEYRLCRVLFGVTSSPFLLNATFIMHANMFLETDPEFVQKLLDSLHVDDLNSSINDLHETFRFFVKCKERLSEAKFNLRKFQSNSVELEEMVNNKFPSDTEIRSMEENNVLGIRWNKCHDHIEFDLISFSEKFSQKPTKRNVIETTASFFDPLGLVNPIIVKLKILFQDVCLEKLDWDDYLTGDSLKLWLKIMESFKTMLNVLIINRQYCFYDVNDPFVSVQLHGFCDASLRAYGCCIYLRFERKSGFIEVALVSSKSKVAPLRKETIPRLELLGASLLARLFKTIKENLSPDYTINDLYAWTDSAVVYCWILNVDKCYKIFVHNRLMEIRKLIDIKSWKLVNSKNNPADLISRGLFASELINNNLWFRGPKFLGLNQKNWPYLQAGDNFKEIIEKEERSKKNVSNSLFINNDITRLSSDFVGKFSYIININNDDVDEVSCMTNINKVSKHQDEACISAIINIDNFSSVSRLCRVTAHIIKFIKKLKKKVLEKKEETKTLININNTRPLVEDILGASEINEAKLIWIKECQKSFVKDVKYLQLKKSLDVFTDKHGFLRCGGRMGNAPMHYDTKHPYLLSRQHRFTELIVHEAHSKVGHNKTGDTLNQIRAQYWIPQGRSFVKKLIHRCQLCRRYEGKPYTYPNHAPLPLERVTHDFAFTNIGIDYAGPVHLRNVYGENPLEMFKAWIALITCSSSRAIHLDLATDYSGDSCIEVLERFINRKGAPKHVTSDNGSNFTSRIVQDYAADKNMNWPFNLEAAPWTGGFFERLIQSVKRCLRKLLLKSRLSYDQMLTLLIKIENIINNRPLTYMYDDVSQSLTPNHLIFGRKLETAVPNEIDGEHIALDFRIVQHNLEYFWEQWKAEYLTALREKHSNVKTKNSGSNSIAVGDVCIIVDDRVPRCKWKLARVNELITSKDGEKRGACVETVSSQEKRTLLRRPINKLVMIERGDDDEVIEEPINIQFVDESNIPDLKLCDMK